MAFCVQCGAQVDGRFCPACGAPNTNAGAATPPGMGAAAPPPAGQVNASGLSENVAGALCYLIGLITGVLFLVLSPYNQSPSVRFHAFQAIFFHVGWIALWIAVTIFGTFASIFAYVLAPFMLLVGFAGFLLWLFLMYRAYSNNPLVLPVIGPLAQQQAASR